MNSLGATRDASKTDDVRIVRIDELAVPNDVIAEHPVTGATRDLVATTRDAVRAILDGSDDRLLVVIGPCSIHDPASAREYAHRLAERRERFADTLEIVMRVYFEKPRTTVGWKGLINDPHMDGSFAINDGLHVARGLLNEINEIGVPTGCEFLDTITPQYVADLVAWGAIGARTTESQVHRELASGLSCPVGFKNGTDGNVRIAVDAIGAASHAHHFLSVTKDGRSAIVATAGNADCHLILRGGTTPNYDRDSVLAATRALETAGLRARLMVDASHGNSEKQYERQVAVCDDLSRRIAAGERHVAGVMVESHLVAGRQTHVAGTPLQYGQSVTDACLGWDASVGVLERFDAAVRARRG